MFVGEWREMLRKQPDQAWLELDAALMAASAQLAQRGAVSPADVEDLAHTAFCDVMGRSGRALEGVRPDTDLVAWSSGVVGNLARRDRATGVRARALGESEAPVPASRESRGAADAEPRDPPRDREVLDALVVSCGATQAQRQVYDLIARDSVSFRAAARRLGVDHKSVRECWLRLCKRMVKYQHGTAPGRDLSWIFAALLDFRARIDLRGIRVIELHAAGKTHAEIARSVGLSAGYVALKIHRARARARQQACPATRAASASGG